MAVMFLWHTSDSPGNPPTLCIWLEFQFFNSYGIRFRCLEQGYLEQGYLEQGYLASRDTSRVGEAWYDRGVALFCGRKYFLDGGGS